MKILIATDAAKINDQFAIRFVEEGTESYKAIKDEDIDNQLSIRNVDVLLIDIDSENYNKLDTVKKVLSDHPEIAVIIMTTKTGSTFFKEVLQIGVYGIVSKFDELHIQYKNIIEIIDKIKTAKDEQRKHIRVKPADFQHNNGIIKVPGLDFEYFGRIKDISIGGTAITITSNPQPPDSLLFKGKKVILNIELGPMNIKTLAIVMLKGENLIGFLFKDLSTGFKRRLAEYIISRLEE